MPENTTPKNWGEARKLGWKVLEVCSAYGYLSRKTDLDSQPLKVCKKGRHKGLFYFESPSYKSTKYHDRVYITQRDKNNE